MGIGFIIFCIGTIGLSVTAELINELRLFKDIADAGYIRDSRKIEKLKKQINPDLTKVTLASLLLPIYNILIVIKNINNYNMVRPQIINILRTSGLLEEMSVEERKQYAKNPTGFHALIIEIEKEIEREKPTYYKVVVIEYADEFGLNKITYDIGRNLSSLTVIDVSGPLEKDWQGNKRKSVENKLEQFLLKGIKRKVSLENFIDSLNNKKSKKPIELLTSGHIYDAYDYFKEEQRNVQEKQGLKPDIINLNQKLDEALFNILNDGNGRKDVKENITYFTDKSVWDVSIRKTSGTLKEVMYSRQFKLIFPLIRGTIAKVIEDIENKPNLLNDKTGCNFLYHIDDVGKCVVEITVKYNALATKKRQTELASKQKEIEYRKHLATLKRKEYTYELRYEESCQDAKIKSQPKLVRKLKIKKHDF